MIINLLIWLIEIIFPAFGNTIIRVLGLHFVEASHFNPVQILTYMFVHDNHSWMHIFFNMFTLWMFGRILEQVWGAKRFLIFYLICGVGAGLLQEAVWALSWQHEFTDALAKTNGVTYQEMEAYILQMVSNHNSEWISSMNEFKNMMVTVGASGAIFGLLLGFAFVFPDMPMFIFFIPVPIKAKYMVIGYGVLEFFFGVAGVQSTVAHFAHLGGMLFALVILLYWKKKGTLRGGRF